MSQARQLNLLFGAGGVLFSVSLLWIILRSLAPVSPQIARAAEPPASLAQPNIVLFVVDTLRADRLQPYGYPRPTSPRLLELADEAVVFEQASAAAPWTLPSMASVMTGRLPSAHALNSTRQSLPAAQRTLAEELRSAGYTTIGLYGNSMVAPEFGFGRGYDFYQVSFQNTGVQVDHALNLNPGRPFFLYVHNLEPHNPEFFAPPHSDGFRDVGPDVRRKIAAYYKAYRIATWEDYEARRASGSPQAAVRQQRQVELLASLRDDYEELYDAAVRLADERVGDMIDTLRARGVWDDALVIFLSDHGEEFNERGGWSHDQSVYQELLHVPLIVKFPQGRFAGTRIAEPVSLVDVYPTVAEWLSRRAPDSLDGRSLLPALAQQPVRPLDAPFVAAVRRNVMSRYAVFADDRGDTNVVVRHGCWKGVWHADLDRFEGFDLCADPLELNPLEPSGAWADAAAALLDAARCVWESRFGDDEGGAAQMSDDTLRNLRAIGYVQ